MKLRTLGLVALVATLGLASCKKEEGPQVDNGPKSVTIQLLNVAPATRAADATLTGGTSVTLNKFQVLFTDGTYLYEGKSLKTDNSGEAVEPVEYANHYFDTNIDGVTGTEHPQVFHFLPAAVNQVIVIGNTDEFTVESGKTTLASLHSTLGNAAIGNEQKDESLYLYDLKPLTVVNGNDVYGHPKYNVTVELKPLVSRVEISSFEYDAVQQSDDEKANHNYTNIKIDQVLFFNYYPAAVKYTAGTTNVATVSGDIYTHTITNQSVFTVLEAEAEAAAKVTGGNWWNDTFAGTPSDNTLGILNLKEGSWGHTYTGVRPVYHFFPVGTNDKTEPMLLIKLIGTKAAGTTHPLYLLAKSFTELKDDDTQGTEGAAITADVSKIYKIDFSFNDDNLEDPEKCVEVTVTVDTWKEVKVTPEFGASTN